MAKYMRVRSTRLQGAHRAGMFFGPEVQVLEKATLSPDQIRLLKDENGRLLLVDEVDDPDEPLSMPGAGEEVFSSRPGKERLERAEAAAEEAQVTIANLQAERDAAKAEVTALQAEKMKARHDSLALQEQLDSWAGAAAQAEAERDEARAELEALKASAIKAVLPTPEGDKPEPKPKGGGRRQPKADPGGVGAE